MGDYVYRSISQLTSSVSDKYTENYMYFTNRNFSFDYLGEVRKEPPPGDSFQFLPAKVIQETPVWPPSCITTAEKLYRNLKTAAFLYN
jgi:hypothetical protein